MAPRRIGAASPDARRGVYSGRADRVATMTHDEAARRLDDSEPREYRPGRLAVALLEIARVHAAPGGATWLEHAAADPGSPLSRDDFASAFAIAARRIGKAPVAPSAEAPARLAAAG